jgi:hypothetical protein
MAILLPGDYRKDSVLTHAGAWDVIRMVVKYIQESGGMQYQESMGFLWGKTS